jgi:hypothetical protein
MAWCCESSRRIISCLYRLRCWPEFDSTPGTVPQDLVAHKEKLQIGSGKQDALPVLQEATLAVLLQGAAVLFQPARSRLSRRAVGDESSGGVHGCRGAAAEWSRDRRSETDPKGARLQGALDDSHDGGLAGCRSVAMQLRRRAGPAATGSMRSSRHRSYARSQTIRRADSISGLDYLHSGFCDQPRPRD